MAIVIAVCKSQEKGTKKKPLNKGVLRQDYGLVGDAHADSATHRQVSLLATESIDKVRGLGMDLHPGDFAENITTEGIDLVSLSVGNEISIGNEVILEISQIGKECHNKCAIYRQIGRCIMPREGIFSRVIKGGVVRVGDKIKVLDGD